MKNNIETKNLIGGFIAGILIGTAVSLLTAPRSGKLARNKLARDTKKFRKQFYGSLNNSLDTMKTYLQKTGKGLQEKTTMGMKSKTEKKSDRSSSPRIGKVASRQDLP